MARESAYLDNIYSVNGGEEMRRYYDDWAKSYDADLVDNDYRTPARCAEALSRYLGDKSAPLLDFACGTGMSGVALRDAGFTHIDGTDISQGMLDVAREKKAYRDRWVCDLSDPFDDRAKGYAAIVAVGAIEAVTVAPWEEFRPVLEGVWRKPAATRSGIPPSRSCAQPIKPAAPPSSRIRMARTCPRSGSAPRSMWTAH